MNNFNFDTHLEQLEWPTLTHYLADSAIFPEVRDQLMQIQPTLSRADAEQIFTATEECLLLLSTSDPISRFEIFFESALDAIRRQSDLPGESLYAAGCILAMGVEAHKFVTRENKQPSQTHYPKIVQKLENIVAHEKLSQKIMRSIDADGSVLDSASTELAQARQSLHSQKARIARELDKLIRDSNFEDALQDKTWMHRDGRYVVPVRSEKRGIIPGTIRGLSQSGSTVFVEPVALQNAQAELEELEFKARLIVFKILHELSLALHEIYDSVATTWAILKWYDELCARAQFAARLGATRPIFTTDSQIRFDFIGARHPLFVFENKKVIPNDLRLAASEPQKKCPQAWVLSGPNAGGKTVAMRTVGVMTLMANAGLFVPALQARLHHFSKVFVEIGDRQNRADSLSSFSGHLLYLKNILDLADACSLILIDEGFVGTDPAIGMALARSTLESLAEKGATVIITTHYTNLKTLAQSDERFTNGSMEFESHSLSPTYRLLNGVPGQSYAIELATRMGFDAGVIAQARSYQGEESNRLEKMLADLQSKKDELVKMQDEYEVLNANLRDELEQFRKQRAAFDSSQNLLMEEFSEKMQKRLNIFSHTLEGTEKYYERDLKRHYKQAILDIETKVEEIKNNDSVKITDENRAHYENQTYEEPEHDTSPDDDDNLHSWRRQPAPKTVRPPMSHSKGQKKGSQSLHDFRQLKEIKLPAQSDRLIEDAKQKSQVLKDAYEKLESEYQKSKHALLNQFEHLDKKANHLQQKSLGSSPHKKRDWQVGDVVRHPKFKGTGKVKRESKQGLVECLFGLIKAKLPESELMTPEEWQKKKT